MVELLVGIGIVAVLISISLPIYSRLTRQARIAHCISNKRAITNAYLLWIGDHDGKLWKCPQYSGFTEWGSPLIGDQKGQKQPGYFTTMLIPYGLEQATWTGWSQPIDNAYDTVWYCPATRGDDGVESWGTTYFFANVGLTGITERTLAGLGSLASENPYLWDYRGNHFDAHEVWPTQGRNIRAYLDGHVEIE